MNCPACSSEMVKAKVGNGTPEYDYCRTCKKELSEFTETQRFIGYGGEPVSKQMTGAFADAANYLFPSKGFYNTGVVGPTPTPAPPTPAKVWGPIIASTVGNYRAVSRDPSCTLGITYTVTHEFLDGMNSCHCGSSHIVPAPRLPVGGVVLPPTTSATLVAVYRVPINTVRACSVTEHWVNENFGLISGYNRVCACGAEKDPGPPPSSAAPTKAAGAFTVYRAPTFSPPRSCSPDPKAHLDIHWVNATTSHRYGILVYNAKCDCGRYNDPGP